MKRTISAMVGKGSVNHNSRKFKAENVTGECIRRIKLNSAAAEVEQCRR